MIEKKSTFQIDSQIGVLLGGTKRGRIIKSDENVYFCKALVYVRMIQQHCQANCYSRLGRACQKFKEKQMEKVTADATTPNETFYRVQPFQWKYEWHFVLLDFRKK